MITAGDIQAVLLGGGGFIGTTMAGIGFYRLCISGAKRIGQIPVALTTAAEELTKLRAAVETDQSMVCLVTKQGGVLDALREDNVKIMAEIELFHRELRLISRRSEGTLHDQSQD
jgi:hypothetical protein